MSKACKAKALPTATVKCSDCGHEQQVTAAVVNENGVAYYGSAYSHCNKCDGFAALVGEESRLTTLTRADCERIKRAVLNALGEVEEEFGLKLIIQSSGRFSATSFKLPIEFSTISAVAAASGLGTSRINHD